ncbi:MAG: response regulator [Desulfobacterales bacterium]|nr:response regulator [Desulfobacterales bacterium]
MNIKELQGSKILIVDDNHTNRALLFNYLSTPSFTVLTSENGEAALKLVKENPPDIILLDIIMPGIDGFETCRRLKQNNETKDIPVLFVSSLSEHVEKIKGFKAGCLDYITKPFQREEVLARVTTHLKLFKLKKKLEEKNMHLQQEIAERRRAERTAESASMAKSEFLANMSHELRTPLNGILGYAQILRKDRNLTEPQKSGLDIIKRSGDHLLNLINRILDISKIEVKKMEISKSDFQFPAFLSGISEMIEVQAYEKGLSFSFEAGYDLPFAVRGDENRLGQVLFNLLGNAVKFTVKGGIVFRVMKLETGNWKFNRRPTGNQPATSNQQSIIRFHVEDTGVGIPKDKTNDIFSPFKQVGEHTRTIEGTGLGLSISQELVRLMGGDLQVKSVAGEGSLFWFDLALPEASLNTVSKKSEEQYIVGYTPLKEKKEVYKILVIDDKWENRNVLISLLVPLGFEVAEADHGRDGIYKALSFKPDLIFMDLIMPVMDGFEATRQIRKIPALSHIKIITVSASTLIPPEQICSETGCNDYISKPVCVHEVLDKLAACLSLEWIYEDIEETVPTNLTESHADCDQTENECLVVPPVSDVKLLHELVLDGNFKGLQDQLDKIEQTDKQYASFTKKISGLAKMLDEETVCEFLSQYM